MSSNRTILELKLPRIFVNESVESVFNRTILELKDTFGGGAKHSQRSYFRIPAPRCTDPVPRWKRTNSDFENVSARYFTGRRAYLYVPGENNLTQLFFQRR